MSQKKKGTGVNFKAVVMKIKIQTKGEANSRRLHAPELSQTKDAKRASLTRLYLRRKINGAGLREGHWGFTLAGLLYPEQEKTSGVRTKDEPELKKLWGELSVKTIKRKSALYKNFSAQKQRDKGGKRVGGADRSKGESRKEDSDNGFLRRQNADQIK